MTGYGVESVYIGDTHYTVEMKSVNHRFLDIQLKLPHTLNFMEGKIKKIIKTYFERGRIEVYFNFTGEHFGKKTLVTDWSLMDQYMEQYELAKKRYNLEGNPIHLLSSIPEVFIVQEDNEQPTELVTSILESINIVSEQVLNMRKEEGKDLLFDIKNRIISNENMLSLIKERRPQVINEYRERILERIIEYTEKSIDVNSQSFFQEIALLAEKGDISEEITRLESHITHFNETIELNEAIGRKLDFIIQEMHREINTVGSKSTDHLISQWTIKIKSELEKIKEQIQNIE